jgi:hypothetical protein
MSKRKNKRKNSTAITTAPTAPSTAITTTPAGDLASTLPGFRPPATSRAPVVLAATLLILASLGLGYTAWEQGLWPFDSHQQGGTRKPAQFKEGGAERDDEVVLVPGFPAVSRSELRARQTTWRPEPWEPSSQNDRVVDRFVKLWRAGDTEAVKLLGGKPLVEDELVPEKAFDARSTDSFLRQKVEVIAIWRGEPDGAGGQKAATDRYTIACKGVVQSPVVRVRTARGEPSSTREIVTNPELVVEVQGGKIHGVRTAAAR